MHKQALLGLALGSALAIGTVAVAAPPGMGGWGGHHGYGQMGMFNKLNLTDAQRAQIKQIMQASRAQNQPARRALQQQRATFAAMPPNAVGYQAAATSLAQAEGQATQQRVERMANVRAQVYAVLTTAQQAQLATLKANAQARRQQWQQFKAEHPLPAGQ